MTLRGDDAVIAAEIARDDSDLLVVTENGYGKRTRVSEYPRKGRGGMGVQTVKLTEARGYLAGARVVRDGYQVMLISNGGTVIKMAVEDVKRLGRSTQGVIVMRLRAAEIVSSLAPVVDTADGEEGDPALGPALDSAPGGASGDDGEPGPEEPFGDDADEDDSDGDDADEDDTDEDDTDEEPSTG
jgi:DNA gyrase subunit A